jgi:pyruvate dehydrogenase E2 component (dihydrolipoamide acetyltransferase)
LSATIDFAAASAWLAEYNRERDPEQRLLPAALLLKSVASALREVPQLNGFYIDGAFKPGPGVHIGWAIALRGGGLVAPAIHDADRLSLPALMQALRDLVQRARAGGLRSSELTDPTLTVTSLGERGAESVLGVIYPPQVAIVGFGRIVERPWVVAGGLVARPLVTATLAADHRASDGHLGGQMLAAIDRLLQAPDTL